MVRNAAAAAACVLAMWAEVATASIFSDPMNQLSDPAITASQTPHSGSYVATNVFDGIFGSGTGEYATTNAVSGDAFIDFDFGTTTSISGFVFYQRVGGADGVTSFQLLFDDASDFASPHATRTFATSGVRDHTLLNDTAGARQQFEFTSGVQARYVRWDVVSAVGNGYDGAAEMEFWTGTTVPEPSLLGIAAGGLLGLAAHRMRGIRGRPISG